MSRSNCGVSSSSVAAIRLRADAARMDGRHEVRPTLAGLAEGDDRPGRDRLGAVHVGVDDVGPDLGQVGGQGPDRDRVVRLLDDEDRRRRRAGACAPRCPPTATRPTRRSGTRSIRVTSENRCSWAPPFVPVARTSTTRIRRPRGELRAIDRASGRRSHGSGCAHVSRSCAGRASAGRARRPRPTRTCTTRCRAGSRAGARRPPGRARPSRGSSARPATGRGRRGRRPRCSRGSRRRVSKWIPAAMRLPATDRKASRSGPSGPWSSNSRRKKTRLCAPPGVSGKRPSSPHFFWWRSMNVSRSASGSGESSNRTGPTASARRTLRRISWRSFLPSVARKSSMSTPVGQRHDRADVLALDVERPALGDLARADGRGERVGRRGRRSAAGAGRRRPTARRPAGSAR